MESRGSLEIAQKVLQRMNAIFRYAIQTGRATYNSVFFVIERGNVHCQ
jgi:hypothetical protein